MSQFDYEMSKHIGVNDYPFYALIMAAMRQADDSNMAKLKDAWPEVWEEFYARYHAPGGVLPGEEKTEQITNDEGDSDGR